MSRLLEALNKNPLTLIVSLPRNSVELAQAAVAGGADALKVHINVKHPAAGIEFGAFEKEKQAIKEILDYAKVPVGIVPGEKTTASESEMEELKRMGIDFFDIHLKYVPPWMLRMPGLAKVIAIDSRYTIDRLIGLQRLGAEGIEAAVIPFEGYGKELTVGDLQHYITIAISAGLPVIVPTQRKVKATEAPIIHDTGAKGLIIGAVVTGTTVGSVKKATIEFRAAIDNL